MTDPDPAEVAAIRRLESADLWGHPKGVYFLAATEAWERFSFYGMRTLLILYMVQELLLPGHVENVAGMDWFRPFIESIFGTLSDQAFASQLFGLYAGFVYFTPLIGGWLADRWLGAKTTVMIGIALMGAGHILMVWEESFLLALLFLVLGSGALKGNVAAQVGHLYPQRDEARRSKGFTIFSTGINIGAIIGPLVCGWLAQRYGWHAGFGTAGGVMALAGIAYILGLPHFAEDRIHRSGDGTPALSTSERTTLGFVLLILAIALFWSLAFDQMFNVGLLWVAEGVALDTSFGTVPVPWFGSEDSFASVVVVPILLGLWSSREKRGRPVGDFEKIATGSVIMALSIGTLGLGAALAGDDGKASILFPLIAFFLSGTSFMYVWPTMLAMVSRRAPRAINARMMAAAYLVAFVSNIVAGFLARFYEPLGPAGFFAMMAVISLTGALLVFLFGRRIDRRLDALDEEQAAAAAQPAFSPAAP
ncbi:peptide MFS transporter [Sphingomicrobium arenosum]|uniref:peptide MFS transporter n=1 Tax=Sphingomicrobium arenosum TaxID=2233861 RepID=UPI002240EBDF|nr:peptide MFS transporter [Sphingomicrobium arenosum]